MIACKRGFTKEMWSNLLRKVKSKIRCKSGKGTNLRKNYEKRYSGGFAFDQFSKSHLILKDLYRQSGLPRKFNSPITLPNKSIWTYFFTKRAFLQSMTEYYESL